MNPAGNVLLDTTVIVAHLRGIAAVGEYFSQANRLYVSVVTVGELHFGIHRSARPEHNLHILRRWLQATTVLPVSEATSEIYGRLKNQLALEGAPIPENDLWISATAIEFNLPVASRDKHFTKVPGLVVLSWSW